MKKPLKIGLTGGIGAGKSLVLKILEREGVPVLQTDSLGHRLLEEKKFSSSLFRIFGKSILDGEGKIDRQKLGEKVFQDPGGREKLNEIMHPEIRKRVAKWIEGQARRSLPFGLVVVEVPLLFERGFNRAFDGVLCVSAPLETRRKRLLKRGWDPVEIRKRERAQWSQTRKNKKADWIISNRRGTKELKAAVGRWLDGFK